MDTQQMKYFLCLAKHLNYTSAASELMVATSTLSRQITMTFAPHIVLAWDKKNNNPALHQFIKEFSGIHDNKKTNL